MKVNAGRRISELAIELQMATPGQVEICLQAVEEGNTTVSLDRLLLDRGFITGDQHVVLIETLIKERISGRDSEKPVRFGQQVIERGFATSAEVDAALKEQGCDAEKGIHRNLGQILIDAGTLTKEMVIALLDERDQVISVCPDCGEKYNVSRSYLPSAKCLQDGASLRVLDTGNASVGVAATVQPESAEGGSPIGMEMGGCLILELIGRGAMARVYKAKHVALNRIVAVKIISSVSRDPAIVKSLLSEARSIARLEHPNIVQVHDVGYNRGYLYIVMQFLQGKPLSNRLRDGNPILEEEGLKIAAEVAEGLRAAHEKGIVHRDIKPDNIVLSESGQCRITDFGLAQDMKRSEKERRAIAGTPFYMSPEQWRGEKADARSDLYSLGILLYRMATGTLPYTGENVRDLMRQHLQVIAKRPRSVNHQVSAGLDAVIRKMIAKEPPRRYQDAAELLRDLKRYRSGEDPKALEMFTRLVRCSFCDSTNPETAERCGICGESLHSKDPDTIELLPLEGKEKSRSAPGKMCLRCGKKPAVFGGVCGTCRRRTRRKAR
jgi:tRNA A-37 threonylcarbamoyl transferase component Bud32